MFFVYTYIQTFTLTTICACPGGCDWKGPTGGGGGEANSQNNSLSKLGIPGIIILSMYVAIITLHNIML